MLLLVGGATGTGKSTIATEAAHRLGITRVTSTDFIRQTMRAFFSEEFMPSVHYSSFEARLALTRAEEEESGDAAILGFLDQTRNVVVGVQAALERAATEHWSLVLEGVHLVPGMIATEFPGAFVVQCVVAIEDENLHRSHFWVRDYATEGLRPAREVPRRATADPADPGLPRGAGATLRRPGHRQRLARPGDRGRHGPRAATRRPARQRQVSERASTEAPEYTGRMVTRDDVVEALHQVEDPELGMDIVELGLMYDVEVDAGKVKVLYSLTSMGCPAGAMIADGILDAARSVPGVEEAEAELTFDPPWTPDRMSDDAKFILGFG